MGVVARSVELGGVAFVDEVSVTAGHWTVCKIESATG